MATSTQIYLLEEVVNRPGSLRVSYFCEVTNESEARSRIKNLISLTTALSMLDRKKQVVGSLMEIGIKARAIAGDDEISVVSEEDS